jgi:CHAD domain-containing protein
MLDNGSLSEREFRTFFYYRLSNIANCTAAMENIQDNIGSWRDLIALMQKFNLITQIEN